MAKRKRVNDLYRKCARLSRGQLQIALFNGKGQVERAVDEAERGNWRDAMAELVEASQSAGAAIALATDGTTEARQAMNLSAAVSKTASFFAKETQPRPPQPMWFQPPARGINGFGNTKPVTFGTMPTLMELTTLLSWRPYDFVLRGTDAVTAQRLGVQLKGPLGPSALHKALVRLTNAWNHGDEEAGDLASAVLQSIGIEWI